MELTSLSSLRKSHPDGVSGGQEAIRFSCALQAQDGLHRVIKIDAAESTLCLCGDRALLKKLP
jgi:hypothetical protein